MTPRTDCSCSRRTFLGGSLGCGAYLAMAMAGASALTRRAFAATPTGETILTKPFARVEKVGDGVWAIISTPFEAKDYTTVSNSGIVAGRDAVVVIDSANTAAGGAWLAATAKELTGRWPTHVVVTHLHGDHTNGLSGAIAHDQPPQIFATNTTRTMLGQRAIDNHGDYDAATHRSALPVKTVLPDVVIDDDAKQTTLDLGGRTLTITLRSGHTPSDITIQVDEPRVLFTGDLVFHGIFPYYGDAIPTALSKNCRAICTDPDTLYVPGHGSLATAADLAPYLEMLDNVGEAAKAAYAKGIPADEAWKTYEIPASLGDYDKFRPNVYQFAFEAWYRELGAK
jgi:glyoxylase-like metal-dependent hydrolase (beta-lactamase superfamily II)